MKRTLTVFAMCVALLLVVGTVPAIAQQDVEKKQQQENLNQPKTPPSETVQKDDSDDDWDKKSDADKRAEIDRVAQTSLNDLFAKSPHAKGLYDKSYGYAIFDNTKVGFGISGGGGRGVAVAKNSGQRTYMKMATGGIGLTIGAQKNQVVFLMEDKATFDKFVNEGWDAKTHAGGVAGKAGTTAEATFTEGIAYYVMGEKGLMATADVSGTKYTKDDELNAKK